MYYHFSQRTTINQTPLSEAKSRAALQTTQKDHRSQYTYELQKKIYIHQEHFSLRAVRNPYALSVGVLGNRTCEYSSQSILWGKF